MVRTKFVVPSQENERHDQLIRMLYINEVPRFSADEVRLYLDILQEDSDTTLPLINRLLTTGTDAGREKVRLIVGSAIRKIHDEYQRSHLNLNWKRRCYGALHPTLSAQLSRTWNTVNVIEETGYSGDLAYLVRDVGSYHNDLAATGFPFVESADTESDAYWRGVTALNLTEAIFSPKSGRRSRGRAKDEYRFYEESYEFIPWAGSHEDIDLVVRIALERGTLNVGTLKMVIDGSSGVLAVSSGVL